MAYNPFDFFRRNQKALFAVITAFVMIMFVLSFGQGDFFQTVPRWLGNRGGQGDVVATVDGRKLMSSDIEGRRGGRVLANQFMAFANQSAANSIAKSLQDSTGTAGERTKAAVEQMLQTRPSYVDLGLLRQLAGMANQLPPDFAANMRDRAITDLEGRLQAILADSTSSKDDQNTARAARALLQLDQVSMSLNGRNYFANMPLTDTSREMLEFDLWLRKADKLGIRLTEAEARKQFQDEFDNRLREADFLEIEKAVGDRQGYTRDRLWTALADEFRVRACQAAVLGTGYGRTAIGQAFVAPYEEYRFYKEQVEPATYAMLAVPAANYLDKVPGQPTDTELRDLFAKYKDTEPSPEAEKPGFKKPRELKIAWAEVKGDEPFYAKAAADALAAAEFNARLAFAPSLGVPFAPVTAAVLAAQPDFALQAAYSRYTQEHGVRIDAAWSWSRFGGMEEVVDASVVKPANLAAAAGAAAGSLLTHGSPFTGVIVFTERVRAEDRNGRARAQLTALAPPSVAGSGVLGNAVAAAARLPAPLPLAVVRGEQAEKVRKALTTTIAGNDVNRFLTEAARLGAKKDKAEARALIERFVSERGLKTGGSAKPHTLFAAAAEPGLAPLKEKVDKAHFMVQKDPTGLAFAAPLFLQQNPRTGRTEPAPAMWTPQPYAVGRPESFLRGDEPEYLFWRTEEVPAVTPKNLDEVRPQVVDAWRRLKARELAKKAAEDLKASITAALAKEPGGTQAGVVDRVVRDEHTKYAAALGTAEKVVRASYFPISGVARLSDNPTSTGLPGRQQTEQFYVRPSENIKFPDIVTMTTELVRHKDDPFGTALLLADQPKDTFYVAVLQRRDERDSQDFFSKMYAQAFPSQLSRTLLDEERTTAAVQARRQAVALLMAEFKVAIVSDKLDKTGSSDGE